jgi:(4S)-4-hydroxy-5-phosphonooxypentane-2,3-dione isomerase
MIATTVYVHVKEEFLEDFIRQTEINHKNSLLEPGNLRFDILQYAEEKTKFTFYEVYMDEAAVMAHKETAHYKIWKDKVEPYMAEPRRGTKHRVLFPSDKAAW